MVYTLGDILSDIGGRGVLHAVGLGALQQVLKFGF